MSNILEWSERVWWERHERSCPVCRVAYKDWPAKSGSLNDHALTRVCKTGYGLLTRFITRFHLESEARRAAVRAFFNSRPGDLT